jgi:hypothetical protein
MMSALTWMIFECQLAISLFHIVCCCLRLESQNLIWVNSRWGFFVANIVFFAFAVPVAGEIVFHGIFGRCAFVLFLCHVVVCGVGMSSDAMLMEDATRP